MTNRNPMSSDPNMRAAVKLFRRGEIVRQRALSGNPMTPRQVRKFLGCEPHELLDVLTDLTAHIELVGPDGQTISPACRFH